MRVTYCSTNAFNLDNASSHCAETRSRYSLISLIGSGLNLNRLSRPARMLCTIPTRSSTRRCLVIACRVSLEPSVSSEMEDGCPRQSFATNNRRVSSPNAAKTGARVWRRAMRLRLAGDIALDVFHLSFPPTLVHAECLEAAVGGNFTEARLNDNEQCAVCGLL